MNVFVKPDEQSQACLSFAMARKRAMKWNKKLLLWQAAEPSGPGLCHVEEFTCLSVAKQTRELNDRHGKVTN